MPFCKRVILPRDLCKPGSGVRTSELFADLVDVCAFTLASVLRQLSDLSRHSLGVLEELEGELASVCRRSGALEGRLGRVVGMLRKNQHTATVGLEAESGRRGGSRGGGDGGGNHHNHAGGGRRGSGELGNGAAHFRSPWQQSVNVFGSWSRPECVEELHQQAQLNLQSLLQDFEEQLCDGQPPGQTFRRPPSQSSDDASPGSPGNKRPDFIFLPASKQLYEDETTSSVFGLRSLAGPSPSPSPSPCESDRLPSGWSAGPPVAEKPRWHLGRRAPAHATAGEGGGKFHGADLLQHSASLSPSPAERFHQPRSLEPVADTPRQNLALRKIRSNLDAASPSDIIPDQPGTMDHSGLLYSNAPSGAWNGPKGSTFSPGAWNEPYNYIGKKGPAVPPKQRGVVGRAGGGAHEGLTLVSNSQSVSSSPASDASGRRRDDAPGLERRSETEGAAADGGTGTGRGRGMSARSLAAANAFKFRERSLSTPTDSDSFCFTEVGTERPDGTLASTGNGTVTSTEHRWQHPNFLGLGENYALLYPRGSSEDSASTADTISVSASDYAAEGRLCLRSRSISLKKSKRKPPPPVRSVSLMKNLDQAEGRIHHEGGLHRDGRPKSLHIPRDPFPDFQPDFLLPASRSGEPGQVACAGLPDREVRASEKEAEPTFSSHWQLGERKSNDPYRSLSGSSTATGTTAMERVKVKGSWESPLDSPATSGATSPSHLLAGTDVKPVSPFKPPGLVSPSSGYSSQSETPTPTVPPGQTAGAGSSGTTGCKMRPKIPERKSSLPSPKDPAARSRLSFEMPGNAHPELSSIKPKQKASRRHSDTSAAAKPGKISPGSSQVLPTVTQNELKRVRLRSVSRGDLEDCPDGASDTIEEEQQRRDFEDDSSPPPAQPKPKPPISVKPPLPKRPLNLLLKSQCSTPTLTLDSPPASPVDRPVPLGNIYKVMKKPKPKKSQSQSLSNASAIQDYNSTHATSNRCLFDLPPLPDPQPLLEDPDSEPGFDPGLRLGPEDGGSLPSPCSNREAPELPDKSKTLPSRMTISCLAELSDKKKSKVPPPVPKKPNVLLLPSSSAHSSTNTGTERRTAAADSPPGPPSPGDPFPPEKIPISPETSTEDENHLGADVSTECLLHSSLPPDSSLAAPDEKRAAAGIEADDDDDGAAGDKTVLHIAEETDEDFPASAAATHTTEDLFTIIHRSKRKVLGRKEPSDSFGSRQSLTSPVKQLNPGQRSSSRNENFMALLQKKGSKSSSAGARVSAAELLKSTNPLARRVTDLPGEAGEVQFGQGKVNDQ
ncbi:NHS-like protein 2 isoform X2 [Syngnathoides biaculeatus]|uniref:NHS-like protein 2 isoform X2 n=1 Tax=Syngnathoides biaculeatus TaxID=300417 RepID=UPI002ADDB3E8|nr:NHS-like protein 2 isoform X2 [Syngnathoides biaculeatus]